MTDEEIRLTGAIMQLIRLGEQWREVQQPIKRPNEIPERMTLERQWKAACAPWLALTGEE